MSFLLNRLKDLGNKNWHFWRRKKLKLTVLLQIYFMIWVIHKSCEPCRLLDDNSLTKYTNWHYFLLNKNCVPIIIVHNLHFKRFLYVNHVIFSSAWTQRRWRFGFWEPPPPFSVRGWSYERYFSTRSTYTNYITIPLF